MGYFNGNGKMYRLLLNVVIKRYEFNYGILIFNLKNKDDDYILEKRLDGFFLC